MTTGDPLAPELRKAELSEGLAAVRARIAAACAAAGRDESQITLIAVTKTFPASDVRLLAGLGVTQVGENRDQEARPKAAQCPDLPLTWHFVGRLQAYWQAWRAEVQVDPIAALDHVVAPAGTDQIGATLALDRVRPALAHDHVPPVRADEDVGSAGPDDRRPDSETPRRCCGGGCGRDQDGPEQECNRHERE